tara:strand:+ start:467 stop:1432 length:966 start_codon:yes stop_codon:yes gene_type:complete
MKADMIHTIHNSNGISARILNFGGIIYEINTPDRKNNFRNIVLNYKDINDYYNDGYYIGAAIGRYANRIKNGVFKLNNETYVLEKNDCENHLHGGSNGFHKVNWNLKNKSKRSIHLRHLCNEKTYPGKIEIDLIYTINEDNSFDIEFVAYSDKDTIFNPTSHSYFNLGSDKTILNHELQINSDKILEIDKNGIPTENILEIKDGPFDFKNFKSIGKDIIKDDVQLNIGFGYDHNFILNGYEKFAATLLDKNSGRRLKIKTDQPGLQIYTGNYLGENFIKNGGVCMETQHYPNSPNCDIFPSVVLLKNKKYYTKTSYHFDTL